MTMMLLLLLTSSLLLNHVEGRWVKTLIDEMRAGISEDTPIGTSIGTLFYQSPQGNAVIYSSTKPQLNVNAQSGEVKLAEKLNYRTMHNTAVIFSAADGNNPTSLTEVVLRILPTNHPPTFDSPSYRFLVKDNVAVGSLLYDQINVIDADQGDNATVDVTCVSGSQTCSFISINTSLVAGFMDRQKVSLRLSSPLSFNTQYDFQLRVTDRGSPPLSSTADINIVVQNSQDSRPLFTSDVYIIQMVENTFIQNRDVLVVRVRDERPVSNANALKLTIERDDKGIFIISSVTTPSTGTYEAIIRQAKAFSLAQNNYNPKYTFVVRATQTLNGQVLSVYSETVTNVNIQDVNDNRPTFNERQYTANVTEGLANGATVPGLQMVVTDKDSGDLGRYVLTLQAPAELNNVFGLSPTTGQGDTAVALVVNMPSFIRYSPDPAKRTYVLTVTARETNTTEQLSSSAQIILQVTAPTNNRPPYFPNRFNPITVSEKTLVDSVISSVIKAEDADSGMNGNLTYSISNDATVQKFFRIDPSTGVLTLRAPLNATVTPSFSFDAIATDGGGLAAFAPIRIDVFNTAGPIFRPPSYQASVDEFTTSLIPAVNVYAEMSTLVSDRVLAYSLVEQQDFKVNDYFSIDQKGLLTMKTPVDYNQTPGRKGFFVFQVSASAVNNDVIPANKATIYIYVIDTNNHDPVFVPSPNYDVSVKETIAPNTAILTVTATDSDTGNNGLVTYLLLDGSLNEFQVSSSGLIQTANKAVLQPERSYTLKVLAIDSGQPPRSATATVVINVGDVIKNSPTYDTKEFTFFIGEDASRNALIGSVRANSNEAKALLRYAFVQDSWRSYNENNVLQNNVPVPNWFSLNQSTAQLSVAGTLSYALASRVTVNVSAQTTNMEETTNPNTAYVLVTINILMVGSGSDRVVFSPFRSTFYMELIERQAINSQVFQFSAFEIRRNSPIRTFNLTSLNANQPDAFIVERETGVMKVIMNLVYVDLINTNFTYSLQARADLPSNAQAIATVVVAILPLSLDPVFNKQEYTFEIRPPTTRLTPVGKVEAKNPFPSSQSQITYSLTNPSDLFQIDPRTGNIALQRALDSQQLLYVLFVRAQSFNGSQLFTSTALVNVRVVRTPMPAFESSSYRFPVPQNSVGPIGRVQAYDANPYNPSLIVYSIYNSTAGDLFSINADSGIIQALQPINRNATLVVLATAAINASFSNSNSTLVHIQTFPPSSQTPNFNSPNFSSIDVLGRDKASFQLSVQGQSRVPGRAIEYSLDPSISPQALNLFRIDGNTGVLSFVPEATLPPGYNSYELVLVISDGFTTQSKKLNVGVFGSNSPSFNCLQKPWILNATITPGPLTPSLAIFSPSTCSDNLPSTLYYFRIIKINGVEYAASPFKDSFVLNQTATNVVRVDATTHLFFKDNLNYRLTLAVGNSAADLQDALQRTSSQLEAVVSIDPNFSTGPDFASSNPLCPGSGLSVLTGILDLTPANSPVYKMVAGDCDADPTRPSTYSIQKMSYWEGQQFIQDKFEQDRQPFVINPLSGLVLTKLASYTNYYRGFFEVVVRATSPYQKLNEAILKVYILREMQQKRLTFNKAVLQATEQRPQLLRVLNRALETDKVIMVADQVTTLVNQEDNTRDASRSSMCYFTVNSDSKEVVVVDDQVVKSAVVKINNSSYAIAQVAQDCYAKMASTQDWSGKTALWYVLIAFAILVFLLALVLACCVCFFWPMNVRKMAENRPYIVLNDPQMSMAGSVFEYK